MADDQPETLQDSATPHSESQLREAEENTARCLEALDQNGEAGLEKELERIYPPRSSETDQLRKKLLIWGLITS